MRNTFNLVWKLFVIALAAGLVLGLVNEITRGPIKAQEEIIAGESRFRAFLAYDNDEGQKVIKDKDGNEIPAAVCETEEGSGIYYLYALDDPQKKPIAYASSAKAKGYKDLVEVVAAVDLNGKIINVVIGENPEFAETAGLGSKIKEPCFINQFKRYVYTGKELEFGEQADGYIIKAGSLKVEKNNSCNPEGSEVFDAVSGATFSSNAALDALNQVLAKLYEVINGGAD